MAKVKLAAQGGTLCNCVCIRWGDVKWEFRGGYKEKITL